MGRSIGLGALALLLIIYLAVAVCVDAASLPARHVARPAFTTQSSSASPVTPPLIVSTFLGGSGFEIAWSCATDSDGNLYTGGDVQPGIGQSSGDLPVTANAVQTNYGGGGQDGFVAKYDRSGHLLWSTYLGGSDWDGVFSVTTDPTGNVVVTGVTASADFPTTANAVQRTIAVGADAAFVTVISADGSKILYSTFLGGTIGDGAPPLPVNIGHIIPEQNPFTTGVGIAVGNDGTIYVCGGTNTIDMPTTSGAVQTLTGGEEDGYVARIDPTKAGTAGLLYCTYLGGLMSDFAAAVAVDSSGNAYVTGETQSQNFPTTSGAFQTAYKSGTDAFVTKLNPTGTSMAYSTLVSGSTGGSAAGGTNYNAPSAIVIDSLGHAFIAGETNATDFPTTAGVVQPSFRGQDDGYVAELSTNGSSLVFSTYLGGSDYDGLFGLKIDTGGNIYVGGYAASRDLNLVAPFQPNFGGYYDGWIAKLSPGATTLLFSSYLGGTGQDSVYGLDLRGDELYVTGRTESADFLTTANAPQASYGGGVWDVFVAEINMNPVLELTSIVRPVSQPCTVRGSAGALMNIDIEATSDLSLQFQPLTSVTSDVTGAFTLSDPGAAAAAQRFYRASYH